MENVPFLDMEAVHAGLEDEMVAVFRQTLKSGRFIGGPKVEGFEAAFASFCEVPYCVGVGSGTDALRFALIAAGIASDDRVITVPNTFIATTEAITQSNAHPVLIDVDERTFTMSAERLTHYLEQECAKETASGQTREIKSGKRVAAVVPVHLYGQMADMDPIIELANAHGLIVIEDACQAHGAEYFSKKQNRWCKAGSMGNAAAFSFYPGKNLGALGEGGAVTTHDSGIAEKIRRLRDHGQSKKYIHEIEGYNGRLDALQADFLTIKLSKLNEWNELRQQIARRYDNLLANVGDIVTPFTPVWARSIYHLYVVRTQRRDPLKKYLLDHGIETGLHYPLPLHLQAAYEKLGYPPKSFPVTEKAALEILSLPMFPSLSESRQERVIEHIKEFYQSPV
ncbi:MAG: erythromycin biosynthesis sensory transduction protein eryC1 [Candidatus Raymondbacteria bacterium RifOxyA12_full_50_37]|uniref:Erythromycin biosynthesis sensory transduction protein eryC1 n=1 Tax=Candidatus Raymondbacteria bacterium RIFOXYD12_FULL_49_13 TaxID=1817890 RepID=A0A1F7F7P9_UNCRA|nr:MAG: erythromycin biosynthesis sensory transduction protein eryC1 [Candidatus Raymondbacteria bacterium RifOxyA12_full_50_37]OGJ85589.1 MAG: erythromycin biosynthesis sensory transduction protein eryC1 [Candidatus Raymondbacteria bacterium RIFOXYA2_FULL_49_16]OGJ92834.1 MAG: erythromycin biosynthesis sensory transduction protein eryC1 [Candidatus Raymondbacteria bacterium RifOxyB12_full_50_8]OGJ95092.1 MAG: erythromycin biosynthesis sensory transduction protein eryC1 [Candidatus Raymondbacter